MKVVDLRQQNPDLVDFADMKIGQTGILRNSASYSGVLILKCWNNIMVNIGETTDKQSGGLVWNDIYRGLFKIELVEVELVIKE